MANRFLSNININDEYTLPSADGTANQIIVTDGAGNLSFDDLSTVTGKVEGVEADIVYYEVKNSTGTAIDAFKGVMAVGTDGNSGHILIDEMVADGSVEARYFLGITRESIPNGGIGRVIAFGEIDQINTNAFPDGTVLWCDPANPGDFTATEPDGPNLKIPAAFVLNQATNGKIQVRVQGNEGIKDLYDTKITSQVDGDVLVWKGTEGIWQNDSTLNVDYTNSRIGIGTTSPSNRLEIVGPYSSTPLKVLRHGDYGNVINLGRNGVSETANIGYPADATLNFSTSGSERMRINSSGNVGIGTSSPNYRLVTFKNNTNYNAFFTGGNGTKGVGVGYDNTSPVIQGLAYNSDTTYYDLSLQPSGGNVGIGTTSPDSKLHLSGDGIFVTDNASAYLALRSGATSSAGANIAIASGDLTFVTRTTGNSERMRITSGGNVGIGTTSPSQKLEVAGNIQATGTRSISSSFDSNHYMRIESSSSGGILKGTDGGVITTLVRTYGDSYLNGGNVGIGTTNPIGRLNVVNGSSGQTYSNISGLLIDVNGTSNVYYGLRVGSNAGDDHLCVTNAGNVGIGRTGPTAKLDVNGEIKSDKDGNGVSFSSTGGGSTFTAFDVYTATNGGLLRLYNESTQTVNIDGRSSGGNTYFNNGGNVGIGTTSPSHKLDVVGNVKISSGGLAIENTSSHGYVALPGGAFYHSTSGTETGAIKITLPTHGTGDMLSFVVDIFDYTTNESFTVNIKGYLYQTTGGNEWVNVSAQTIASAINRNFTVRFGADGSNNCVWIGETNSVWSYPQIQVRDFTAGFSADMDSYIDGWDVDIVTSFDTVDETYYSPFPMSKEVYGSGIHLRGSGSSYFNGGNVGIGTTNPGYTLDVNGTLHSSNITLADGIYHEGDTNTYINFLSDHIQMATAGSVRAYINSSGNVGIGTTSPQKKLDISGGDIRLDNSKSIFFASTDANIGRVSITGDEGSDFIRLKVDNSNSHVIQLNTTGVGIGTTSPSDKLEVYGGNLIVNDGTSKSRLRPSDLYMQQSGVIKAWLRADGNSYLNGGNVGIGTTSPTYKLDVAGDIIARDTYPSIYVDHSGTVMGGLRSDATSKLELKTLTTAPLSFQVNSSEKMRITDAGNVGIGTNSPVSKLHINGSSSSGLLRLSDVSGTARIASSNLAASAWEHLELKGNNILLSPQGGNVGIGTTSPGAPLHLQSSITNALKLNNSSNSSVSIVSDNTYLGLYPANYIILGKTTLAYADLMFLEGKKLRWNETDGSWYDLLVSSGTDNLIKFGSVTSVSTGGDTAFYHNSSEKMRLTSTGLGIGTTSPSTSLHIAADTPAIRLQDNTSSDNHYLNGNNGEFRIQTTGFLTLRPGNTESVRFLANGNVGIGTTSPGYKLDVDGEARFGDNGGVLLTDDSGTSYVRALNNHLNLRTTRDADDIYFSTGTTTTTKMFIQGDTGNVGIGTTSPSEKLHVYNGTSYVTPISYAANQSAYALRVGAYNNTGFDMGLQLKSTSGGSPYMSFKTNTVDDVITMWGGSVGVGGTALPSYTLDVKGVIRGQQYLRLADTGGTNRFNIRAESTYGTIDNGSNTLNYNANNHLFLVGFSEKMRINSSGNVGIGTTSPSQKLDVNGNIECSSLYLNNNSTLFLAPASFGSRIHLSSTNGVEVKQGSTYKPILASAFTVSSDYRLKSNIVPLENAIDRLNQLDVHRFNWNDRLDEPKVDGFIAHEVATVIPEAVLGEKDGTHPDGTPDYQGIDQSKIVPLLTAALQEAVAKIEDLETRIQTLENK